MSSKRRANKSYAKGKAEAHGDDQEDGSLTGTLPVFSSIPAIDEQDFSQGKFVIGGDTVTVFTPKGFVPSEASKKSKGS